ncbi:hypothetical protein ACH4CC_35005 [Streptomyces lydicus]|uniref:hypothetical protein n=1 Tax=Streptomyces lydicus TaxID=47763 RepID=UPI0037907686
MTTTETRPARFFASPDDIKAGSVVYDQGGAMVGMVRRVAQVTVILERPTGLIWSVPHSRLRPGTEREARQLQALAKLQRVRRRGLA